MKKRLYENQHTKAKFGIVKHLYSLIKDKDILDGELELKMWAAELDVAMRKMAQKLRVVDIKPSYPKAETEEQKEKQRKIKEVFEILEEATVLEAMDYVSALENAVFKHKYKVLADKKISDLGIELLEDETKNS